VSVEVGEGCDVERGEWLDPYATAVYRDPSEIEIDHLVPLAYAGRSGASSWSEGERERYANAPYVLLSVEDDPTSRRGTRTLRLGDRRTGTTGASTRRGGSATRAAGGVRASTYWRRRP